MSLENWRTALWWILAVAGVIGVIATFALNIVGRKLTDQAAVKGKLRQDSGALVPANDAMPTISAPSMEPIDLTPLESEILCFLGKVVLSTADHKFTVLRVDNRELVKIERGPNGIFISADIWSDEDKIIATIDRNDFKLSAKEVAYFNRPDESTLEVFDDHKRRILYVRLLNNRAVKITGTFRGGDSYPVIIDDEQVDYGPFRISSAVALRLQGPEPLLDFPASSFRFLHDSGLFQKKSTFVLAQLDNLTAQMLLLNGKAYSILQTSMPKSTSTYYFGFMVNDPAQLELADTRLRETKKSAAAEKLYDKQVVEMMRMIARFFELLETGEVDALYDQLVNSKSFKDKATFVADLKKLIDQRGKIVTFAKKGSYLFGHIRGTGKLVCQSEIGVISEKANLERFVFKFVVEADGLKIAVVESDPVTVTFISPP